MVDPKENVPDFQACYEDTRRASERALENNVKEIRRQLTTEEASLVWMLKWAGLWKGMSKNPSIQDGVASLLVAALFRIVETEGPAKTPPPATEGGSTSRTGQGATCEHLESSGVRQVVMALRTAGLRPAQVPDEWEGVRGVHGFVVEDRPEAACQQVYWVVDGDHTPDGKPPKQALRAMHFALRDAGLSADLGSTCVRVWDRISTCVRMHDSGAGAGKTDVAWRSMLPPVQRVSPDVEKALVAALEDHERTGQEPGVIDRGPGKDRQLPARRFVRLSIYGAGLATWPRGRDYPVLNTEGLTEARRIRAQWDSTTEED